MLIHNRLSFFRFLLLFSLEIRFGFAVCHFIYIHANDSVVLIVLLSMSQRDSNLAFVLFFGKNIGSATITTLYTTNGAGVTNAGLQ